MNKDQYLDGHILNLIQNHEVQEQSELQQLLEERGYSIPQATLSRRLKKLNVAKVSGVYQIVDYNQPYIPVVLHLKISHAGIIILHTHPGSANSLGYYFDNKYVAFSAKEKKDSPILGTIAGDDTVLLITNGGVESLSATMALIAQEFPYLAIPKEYL